MDRLNNIRILGLNELNSMIKMGIAINKGSCDFVFECLMEAENFNISAFFISKALQLQGIGYLFS
jgi:hypothetical protein